RGALNRLSTSIACWSVEDEPLFQRGDEHTVGDALRRPSLRLLAGWGVAELFSYLAAVEQQLSRPLKQEHSAVHRLGFSGPSMTRSPRSSSDGGMVSPSVLAVFRLMTRANRQGCSTGRSAGLTPLRTLFTNTAAC